MFLLALLAVLGETIVHGAASLAQAALRARALDAARTAFVSGERAAQASFAQGTAPEPIATCAFADANGCEINVQTTIAAATPSAAPAATACPGTPCTVMLQGNSAVSEGRTTFLISSVVSAATGATLATRSGTVAFRTFAAPPYAAIVGDADATLSALLDSGAADDAGEPTTLITVEYDPNGGGANTAGNVWQPVIENPPSAAPAWEP
jgi:hypothetical protein